MTRHAAQDLTGEWQGTYSYPAKRGPVTPFIATIEDLGGHLSGCIIEPDAYHRTGQTLEARLVGSCDGRSVDFTKSYVMAPFGYENPVDYVGQLSPDGLTVTGVWSLLDYNGQFEMHRDMLAESSKETETAVSDELPFAPVAPYSLRVAIQLPAITRTAIEIQ